MADDPTEFARWAHELRAAMNDLRLSIEALVRRDVYESDQRGVAAQISTVAKDVSDIEKRLEKQEDDRKADRRLLIAAFVAPLLMYMVNLYMQSKGAA